MNAIETLNHWGGRFADVALPMLVQSSLLIIVLFALDLVLRNRVRAVVRYALWMLVLIKLVLPPSFAAPTGLAYWLPHKKTVRTPPAPSPQFVVRYSDVQFDEARPLPSLPLPRAKLQVAGWLLLGWLATALGLMAWLVRRSRSVVQTASQALPASDSPKHLLDACLQQMGIKRRVRLKLSATASSPAVCGLWRPVILIPQQLADKLSALQLRAVLLHELAHIKRNDVWVHYAQTLLQIFYWWHPLLWLANAQIRRVREQAVDEMVMVQMGLEAETYPATLLEVAKLAFKRPMLALGLIGIVESKSALAQRIQTMIDRPIPRSARLGFTGLAALLLTGAAVLPMARGQRTPQQPSRVGSEPNQQPVVGMDVKFIEIEESQLPALGLGEPTLTEFNGHRAWALTPEQLNGVLQRALEQTGADVLAANRVTTLSGRQSQIQVVDVAAVEGSEVRVGPTCDLTPFVTDELIELVIAASVTERKPADPNAASTSVADIIRTNDVGTARVIVGDGGGVVLENPEARSSKGNRYLVIVSATLVSADHAAESQTLNQASTATTGAATQEQEAPAATFQNSTRTRPPNSESVRPTDAATKNGDAGAGEGEPLTVTIARTEPHLYIGSESVTVEELKTRLRRAVSRDPAVTLSLRADTDAPFGEIVKVTDTAKEAGVKSISAFTRAQPTNSSNVQPTNTVTSSEGQGTTKRFASSTGQGVEIEAIKPGQIQYDPQTGISVVTNDFAFRFEGAVLTARRAQINTKTGEVTAEGDVILQHGDQVLRCERLQYNFIHQKITGANAPAASANSGSTLTTSTNGSAESNATNREKTNEGEKPGDSSVSTSASNHRRVPVLGDLPFVGGLFRSEATAGSRDRQRIQTALHRIVLPQAAFDHMRLPDVLQWLSNQARERDPEGKGINFIINTNVVERALPTTMEPTIVDPITGKLITLPSPAPLDMSTVVVHIAPDLKNMRLSDVLEAIVRVADKPIKYTLADYGVIFSPGPPQDSGTAASKLVTRIYRIRPEDLREALRKLHWVTEPGFAVETNSSIGKTLSAFFQQAGVKLEPPTTVFYSEGKGTLFVRAEPDVLESIQKAIATLSRTAPRQILIETRFIEAPTDFLRKVGLDAIHARPGEQAWATVFTAAEARALLQETTKTAGVDVLSAPRVTTLEGRQTQIQAVEVKAVATDINPQAKNATGLTSTNGVEPSPYLTSSIPIGATLDLMPEVAEDGYTLRLLAVATATEFLGYDRERAEAPKARVWIDRKEQAVAQPLPIFRTRHLQATANLYDGQTLVLGGAVPVVTTGQPNGKSEAKTVAEDDKNRLLVVVTPVLIDPAGSPMYSPGKEPFPIDKVPPQLPR